MANTMMEMLADVPPMLIAGWMAWFVAGGVLATWYRRASLEEEFAPVSAQRAVVRPKPASKPSPEAWSLPVAGEEPVVAMPLQETPAPAAARSKGPLTVGDPYGDLATLLDQPSNATSTQPSPREPAASPILSSAGSVLFRNDPS
jgi:hypothetical protein